MDQIIHFFHRHYRYHYHHARDAIIIIIQMVIRDDNLAMIFTSMSMIEITDNNYSPSFIQPHQLIVYGREHSFDDIDHICYYCNN